MQGAAAAPVPLGKLVWQVWEYGAACNTKELWHRVTTFIAHQAQKHTLEAARDNNTVWRRVLSDGVWDNIHELALHYQQFMLFGLYFFMPAFRALVRSDGLSKQQLKQLDHLGMAWCCLYRIFASTGEDEQAVYNKDARNMGSEYTQRLLYRGVIDFTNDMITILFTGCSTRSNMRFHEKFLTESFRKQHPLFDKIRDLPQNASRY
jgi:hypothetical protein